MRLLVAALMALTWIFLGVAHAQQNCQGRDLMPELAARDPAAHARVVEDGGRTANGGAVLWKVERTGLDPSWLVGTIHMSDPRVSVPSPAIQAALDSARAIALEIADLAPDAMMSAMGRRPELFVFQDGRTLARLLSPSEFAETATALEASGIPRSAAPVIRPWLAFTVVSMSACERQRSTNGERVLDQRLEDFARTKGLPVIGLETIESQLSILAALPEDQQIGMLRAALKYAGRSNDVGETLIQLYLKRQIGLAWPLQLALAAEAGIGPEMYRGFEADLVIARNRRMAEAARPLLDQEGAVIAIGSLHLVGDTGLIELVRQAGYTVTAVD